MTQQVTEEINHPLVDLVRDTITEAYSQGCWDTHQSVRDDPDHLNDPNPEFGEAASDFLASKDLSGVFAALSAAPAPTGEVVGWEEPVGSTIQEMKESARQTELYKRGDMKLIWVNEGDFFDRAAPPPAVDGKFSDKDKALLDNHFELGVALGDRDLALAYQRMVAVVVDHETPSDDKQAGLCVTGERQAIVAWLHRQVRESMKQAQTTDNARLKDANEIAATACRKIADSISNGEHLTSDNAESANKSESLGEPVREYEPTVLNLTKEHFSKSDPQDDWADDHAGSDDSSVLVELLPNILKEELERVGFTETELFEPFISNVMIEIPHALAALKAQGGERE